jgi:Fe-Mn family superoxide dismutase
MGYKLPELPYAYDALEPYLDARTLEIHHAKHHAGYVSKLNAAVEGYSELQGKPIEALLSDIASIPEEIRTAVRNTGGGHANHTLFWIGMAGEGGGKPGGSLKGAVERTFGGFDNFKEQFSSAALTLFGSGWAWLVLDEEKNLSIQQTSNQDTPLSQGLTPILTLDVWEHAYYLKYQNRRADFVAAWWNVVNWAEIGRDYDAAMG